MLKNFQHREFILPFEALNPPIREFVWRKAPSFSRSSNFAYGDSSVSGSESGPQPISPDSGPDQSFSPPPDPNARTNNLLSRYFKGRKLRVGRLRFLNKKKRSSLNDRSYNGLSIKKNIYNKMDPEEIARAVLRESRYDKKAALKKITHYINRTGRRTDRYGRPVSLGAQYAKEIVRNKMNYSNFYPGCYQLVNFNRILPSPCDLPDSSTVARAGVVNQTVMLPITSRNAEVLEDTLSSYPPEIQIQMAEYYIGQALASVEEYFWRNGFFKSPMDHVTWLAKWSDALAKNANIDYVTRVLSHLNSTKYL